MSYIEQSLVRSHIGDLRADADAFVQDRQAGRVAAPVTEDLEDGERTAQERVVPVRRLDHHELSGSGQAGDFGSREREHAVVVGEPGVRRDLGVDVAGHTRSIHFDTCGSFAC